MVTPFNRNNPKTIRRQQGSRRKPDMQLLATIFLLSVFGSIMVYSGSVLVAVRQGNSPNFYFVRQLGWIVLGLVAAYGMYRMDYKLLPRLALPLLLGTIFLLILVLFVNYDPSIKRWIDFG